MLEKYNDSLEEKANITEIESEFMQDSLRHQLKWSLEAIGVSKQFVNHQLKIMACLDTGVYHTLPRNLTKPQEQ